MKKDEIKFAGKKKAITFAVPFAEKATDAEAEKLIEIMRNKQY